MKDIHDFAAASLPGVMLEVMVLKKQMEPEILAERSYTIGRAMMAEAVKNGWKAPNPSTAASTGVLDDAIRKADEEFERMNQRKSAKVVFDTDGEPLPNLEEADDDERNLHDDDLREEFETEEDRIMREEAEALSATNPRGDRRANRNSRVRS